MEWQTTKSTSAKLLFYQRSIRLWLFVSVDRTQQWYQHCPSSFKGAVEIKRSLLNPRSITSKCTRKSIGLEGSAMKFVEEMKQDTGMGTSKAKQSLIKILKMKIKEWIKPTWKVCLTVPCLTKASVVVIVKRHKPSPRNTKQLKSLTWATSQIIIWS